MYQKSFFAPSFMHNKIFFRLPFIVHIKDATVEIILFGVFMKEKEENITSN
jgi:hypothetical protein